MSTGHHAHEDDNRPNNGPRRRFNWTPPRRPRLRGPAEMLSDIFAAIHDADADALHDAAESLDLWLDQGGTPPPRFNAHATRAFTRTAREMANAIRSAFDDQAEHESN